jgi:hypothetical protein
MLGLKYFILYFSVLSAHAAVSDTPYAHVICKNQKIVRTIRVEKGQGKCETLYTKNGKDQVIATGYNAPSCKKFLTDVQENLTKAGWKCRETQQSVVSELSAQ